MAKVKMFRMVLVLLMLFSCLSLNIKAATSFSDVAEDIYYTDAVQWAVDNSITYGMGDGTFGVSNTVTRGQAVTFLWRAAGKPNPTTQVNPFTDVKEDDYSKDAILWAVENSITEGMGDNKFEPDGSVTRGQMITFLWRSNGKPKDTGGAWYEAAENWANDKGILNGTSQKYSTDDACPRCDVVYYLWMEMSNTSGTESGDSGNTSSGGGSTTSSREEEIKQREQELYGQYGGYEGYIDWLYEEYEGKYTRDELKKVNPNMSDQRTYPGHGTMH